MASITVQFTDGRETFSEGIQSQAVLQAARACWQEDGVAAVLVCDGDPDLLSAWGVVTEVGNFLQPDMSDMRRLGLDIETDDLDDDITDDDIDDDITDDDIDDDITDDDIDEE